jgi:hypothetical protein
MDRFDPARPDNGNESAARDLARRLERYRSRVEAEGRPRSVRLIDRAIEDAERKPGRDK